MDYAMPIASEFPPFELDSTVTLTTVNPRNYSGLLTACGSSQEVFVLRAVPPPSAQPAAQKDASRRMPRGIRHLSSYYSNCMFASFPGALTFSLPISSSHLKRLLTTTVIHI